MRVRILAPTQGPGGFLLGMSALELSTLEGSQFTLPASRIEVIEGCAAMGGSILYVTTVAWKHGSFDFINAYSFREQQVISTQLVLHGYLTQRYNVTSVISARLHFP